MNNETNGLDETEAFRAMCHFLDEDWKRGKSEEIAILLGSMRLLEDGKPADPAMWSDWLAAIEKTRK